MGQRDASRARAASQLRIAQPSSLPGTRPPRIADALLELKVDLGKLRASLHLVRAQSSLTIPRVRAVADSLEAELTSAKGLSSG